MSSSLRLDLSIPDTKEEFDGTVRYVIMLGKEGSEEKWSVKKRYSELEVLHQFLKKENVPLGAEFPKKGFAVKITASKKEERRLMFEAYLQELVGLIALPSNVKDEIDKFLEITENIGSTSENVSNEGVDENKTRSPIRPVSSSPQRTTFFNRPVGSGESNTRTKPKKEYPVEGDGIRDAIKCRDKYGVLDLIGKDKELVKYVDGHGDSMLHLACIFNESDIAMTLVELGADVALKNGMDETPLDVCQPTLKKKILAKRKKMGLDN